MDGAGDGGVAQVPRMCGWDGHAKSKGFRLVSGRFLLVHGSAGTRALRNCDTEGVYAQVDMANATIMVGQPGDNLGMKGRVLSLP